MKHLNKGGTALVIKLWQKDAHLLFSTSNPCFKTFFRSYKLKSFIVLSKQVFLRDVI
jgi:hypothetical protein